ncbi:ABC transporter substrate-binding protein [Paenalcaligenes niemegkensis]|uniref:ABC transporter substrate-binding protein n=1 Tax=Paenalcaligenes niemegkensis TaxID=2895469 RepID=UPI001EE87CDE|nr:ABC transporter substrate-binding protein [Paenalcaligenes niemegkensis]MCQ9618146.1 ABC transporter substrate-binding protein [Paenalcaligenes niemegkensis]
MKRSMKLLKGVLGGVALLMASAQAQAQTAGGSINVILNPEPPTLIYALNQQTPTQIAAGKIYEGLLTYDFDLNPQPSLAKSWEVSPDGLSYTFQLQEGVKWHDGEPFTAEDVRFSLQEMLADTHSRARANLSRIESIDLPDEHTIVITLKEPFAPFINTFEVSSAPMMPAHLYKGTDYRSNPANQKPIGTGPFKFNEWQRGRFVHVVRNDDYWQEGLPYLDSIYFQVIPDAASRLVALENGSVQVASFGDIDFAFLPQLQANPQLDITNKGYEFAGPQAFIELNHRDGPSADKRFRQAVQYAIDRDFIAKRIFFGAARPATGPISSVTKYHVADAASHDYDPEKAIALLDDMGLTPDANGKRATVKLLGLPYGDTWNKVSEYIKNSLSKVGVEVILESTDAGNWASRYSNWDFEMVVAYLYQYSDPALGVDRTYLSDNIRQGIYGTNASGYQNPEVDRLFKAAAVENDTAKRKALYEEVTAILVEDAPSAWLVELSFPTITNKSVKNVTTSAIGVAETFATTYIEK